MRNVANSILEVSIAKGEARGRVEGRIEGVRATLRKLLLLKFGALDAETGARVERESVESVLAGWTERVLSARTQAEVFGEG